MVCVGAKTPLKYMHCAVYEYTLPQSQSVFAINPSALGIITIYNHGIGTRTFSICLAHARSFNIDLACKGSPSFSLDILPDFKRSIIFYLKLEQQHVFPR